jgi:preprotein translocase subunit SecF
MNRKERRKHLKKKTTQPKKEQSTPEIQESSQHAPKGILGNVQHFYEKYYKQLFIIPLLLLVCSIGIIGFQIATTGDFIQKGISLSGGVTFEFYSSEQISADVLQDRLDTKLAGIDTQVRTMTRTGKGFGTVVDANIDVGDNETYSRVRDTVSTEVESLSTDANLENTEVIGAVLGQSFFRTAIRSVLVAFLFMGVVVFLYFRNFAPSIAVIGSAVSDIVITVAVVNLLGIRVTTAGIAAFLMLIGYSVDTDILLTSRVLKRKAGTIMERIYGSFKTGIVMTLTTLLALIAGLFVAKSEVLVQILLIVTIGLSVDIINTWIQTVGILRLYFERKGIKEHVPSHKKDSVNKV